MKKGKVLITGSNGVIGTILMEKLVDLDLYGVDIAPDTDNKHYYKIDISDLTQLYSVFKNIRDIDFIIHLAADSRVNASWESVLKNNIIGTRNIYECARKHSVKKIVYASSNHVTGGYEGIPPRLHKQKNPPLIRVSDHIRPDSDYGTSKVFGEAIARQYLELFGLSSICLRIGTVLKDDDPTKSERIMRTWLSHRDLLHLIEQSLFSRLSFGIYYGVSGNDGRFWDISNAVREIGYNPQDNAFLRS
jgi:nucleoside-diphosphate-sugar epimerase